MDVLLCMTVEGPPGCYLVPGSKKSNCQDCKAEVWVAPSSQKVMDKMIVRCLTCAMARAQSDSVTEHEILPDAVKEIETYRKRN